MKRIIHISDTHGRYNELYGNFDMIVHSGDFIQDPNPDEKDLGKAQLRLVQENIKAIKKWIGNKKFLYSRGNHDWMDPWKLEELLRKHDIDAYCVEDKIVEIDDVSFYGFPYLPPINGLFACETAHDEMDEKISLMADVINANGGVDVIITHCPPKGYLDYSDWTKEHYGNQAINDFLDDCNNIVPRYVLFGHCHGAYGMVNRNGVMLVNSAKTQNLLEIH